MTNERIIQIDSVDAYNKLYGWETLHPLVTVVRSALPLRLSKNHANPMASDLNHLRLRSTLVALLAKNYGLYALFLKQGDGCSSRPVCPSARSPINSALNIRNTSRASLSRALV